MDEQLLRDFLAEADERVEALFGEIRTLRARRGEGRVRRELVARIFRHVHTIKGTSAAAGLDSVARLAHELETLLDAVRDGSVQLDDAMLDALEESVEAIAAGLSAAARGEASTESHELIARLRRLSGARVDSASRDSAAALSLDTLPDEVSAALGEHERRRATEAVGEGARLELVSVDFGLEDFDERVRELSAALAEGGEVVATIPHVLEDAPERVGFRIVYATREAREKVLTRITAFGATLQGARDGDLVGEMNEDSSPAAEDEESEDTFVEDSRSAPTLSSLTMLVRVSLEELDELSWTAHELYGDTTAALDLALGSLQQGAARARLEAQAERLRRRFSELEDRLIEMRTVSARPTLERAARIGASAARASAREVEFITRGEDVRLDKSLAESVAGPLVHLVRNAVDHGIESADVRIAAGKTARARVLLEAVAEDGRVLLRVADDGRGIDADYVARVACERGLVGADEKLTAEQAMRLIFRPGFSTARELSSVSGRGVGLDVVERAVEEAGGEVRVWTRAGAGTTFELRLPTPLALVPSLIVSACGESYCVASSHVEYSGDAAPDCIEVDSGGRRVVRWRDTSLPLVTLGALLGRPDTGTDASGAAQIIVSHVAAREGESPRAAVAVDALERSGEVLVRGLGRHAGRWRGVVGATELRDGEVALVLDLPRLLELHL